MARADSVDVCEALDKRAWRRLANRQVLDVTMRVSVSHRVGRTALARKFGLPAGAAATVTDGAASRAFAARESPKWHRALGAAAAGHRIRPRIGDWGGLTFQSREVAGMATRAPHVLSVSLWSPGDTLLAFVRHAFSIVGHETAIPASFFLF